MKLKAWLPIVAVVAGVGLLAAPVTNPVAATGDKPGQEVCLPLDSGKIDTTGDPMSVEVTAPEGKLIFRYCYKAGTQVTYVVVNPPLKTVVIKDTVGKIQAISHYSVQYVKDKPTTTTSTTSTTTSTTSTTPDRSASAHRAGSG